MTALAGLYAITDAALTPEERLLPAVEAALRGGARVVQYRDKGGDGERRRREAAALVRLCGRYGVPLIVNDDAALAAAVGAAGVHLGRDDGDLAAARALLGPAAIIGLSCYDEPERARAAQAAGASYVAFGAFFPSPTKPHARRATVELLRTVRTRIALPIVCIGGITPENGGELVAAGADMVAAISGVFGTAQVEAAARRYAALFAPRS